ncbi:LLM class F420-dependent oxidoreductase [Streptomonospora halophila]|uniref:LLM class F420-dependent oxidoreductase n=2 Tax=Streptomonospora halophila TaxID=427369 RepID=A0ABP9GEV0_9ACTN
MKYGILMFPTHDAIDPATLAREAEDRGFESLLFPEHSHIPVSRRSPYPGGGDLPRMYLHTYDPFVALSYAASATTTLRIGTGVCLVTQRDPIHTAKEAASLDFLSGGRFLFGVGAGWNREEMADHGTDARTRMRRMAENVKAVKELWTKDEAEFHGEFVDFEKSWAWPKPAQKPHPPVIVGGNGPTVEERVVDFGDEWMPQGVTLDTAAEFGERVTRLQRLAAEAGRGTIPVSMYYAVPDEKTVDAYAEAGVGRVFFGVDSAGRDTVLPQLDELARQIR